MFQGRGPTFIPNVFKFLSVKNQIVVIFPSMNTQLNLYCGHKILITKGARYFQFMGIPIFGQYGICSSLWVVRKD